MAFDGYVKIKPPDSPERAAALAKARGGMRGRAARRAMTDAARAQFRARMAAVDTQFPPPPMATVADFVNHIDYLVKTIGIDHVGISSDFDGGGGVAGWNGADETFNVTLELVRRGYTEEQIGKLWSGNLLRVMAAVERVAQENPGGQAVNLAQRARPWVLGALAVHRRGRARAAAGAPDRRHAGGQEGVCRTPVGRAGRAFHRRAAGRRRDPSCRYEPSLTSIAATVVSQATVSVAPPVVTLTKPIVSCSTDVSVVRTVMGARSTSYLARSCKCRRAAPCRWDRISADAAGCSAPASSHRA